MSKSLTKEQVNHLRKLETDIVNRTGYPIDLRFKLNISRTFIGGSISNCKFTTYSQALAIFNVLFGVSGAAIGKAKLEQSAEIEKLTQKLDRAEKSRKNFYNLFDLASKRARHAEECVEEYADHFKAIQGATSVLARLQNKFQLPQDYNSKAQNSYESIIAQPVNFKVSDGTPADVQKS